MDFTVQVAGKTDVGCVRTNNEDSFGYDTESGIFIVCDGMGGAAAGEVASQLGVSTVLLIFVRRPRRAHIRLSNGSLRIARSRRMPWETRSCRQTASFTRPA